MVDQDRPVGRKIGESGAPTGQADSAPSTNAIAHRLKAARSRL
jgi:hypothetical protein